jgi:hypothetical protein
MSLASLFKAAQATAKTSKAFKTTATAGRAIWTLAEIADMGMDTYILGDEIARAIMGDNYDPEIKSLSQQVAEKGVQYDRIMTEIAQAANVDIPNLSGAITRLHSISIDFETTNGTIFEKCKKLEDLRLKLLGKVPTSYTWFTNPPSSVIVSEEVKARLEAIRKQLSPDYATIGLHSAGIALRSAYLGYSLYKKKTRGTVPPTRPRRNAMANIFEGMDAEEIKRIQSGRVSKFKQVRTGFKTYGTIATKGFTKLLSAGSFGMNIYLLIHRQEQKEKAKQTLREMIAQYDQEIRNYGYVMDGCKHADGTVDVAGIQTVATLFELDLANQDADAKETLAIGYRGVLAQYDESIDNLVNSIDGTYQKVIEALNEVSTAEATDEQVVQNLRTAYIQFQPLQSIGKDEKKDSDQRKSVLDQIATLFSNSIAKQINEINQSLTKEIENHKAFSMLEPYAKGILKEVKRSNITITDNFLREEAEFVKEMLDEGMLERDRFTTVDEIFEGLKKLIAELQKEASPKAA